MMDESRRQSSILPLYISEISDDVLVFGLQSQLAPRGAQEKRLRIAAHAHHSTTRSQTQRRVTSHSRGRKVTFVEANAHSLVMVERSKVWLRWVYAVLY